MDFLASEAETFPSGYSFSLLAFEDMLTTGTELVCVSGREEVSEELRELIRKESRRQLSVLFKCPANEKKMAELAPFTKEYPIPESGEKYYLCKNRHQLARQTRRFKI